MKASELIQQLAVLAMKEDMEIATYSMYGSGEAVVITKIETISVAKVKRANGNVFYTDEETAAHNEFDYEIQTIVLLREE